jgi:hypothetical protein
VPRPFELTYDKAALSVTRKVKVTGHNSTIHAVSLLSKASVFDLHNELLSLATWPGLQNDLLSTSDASTAYR